jgi:hypothetical protein
VELLDFSKAVGKKITAYGSRFIMTKIVTGEGPYHIGSMYFGENEWVGRHDAVTPQLFLVVQGDGWVSGQDEIKKNIKAGEAAFWINGESHEAGTATGMIAIVIEGENINPLKIMKALTNEVEQE